MIAEYWIALIVQRLIISFRWFIVFYYTIHFFFLSNDLHILQTTYITNKNITKITIWKTKQNKHWTLCAIIKSNNVIKTKGI